MGSNFIIPYEHMRHGQSTCVSSNLSYAIEKYANLPQDILHCCFTSVLGQLPRTHMLVVITTILNHYDNMTGRHEGRREMLDTCFDIGHL